MAALNAEDPCPYCGSLWDPHACHMASNVAHHEDES